MNDVGVIWCFAWLHELTNSTTCIESKNTNPNQCSRSLILQTWLGFHHKTRVENKFLACLVFLRMHNDWAWQDLLKLKGQKTMAARFIDLKFQLLDHISMDYSCKAWGKWELYVVSYESVSSLIQQPILNQKIKIIINAQDQCFYRDGSGFTNKRTRRINFFWCLFFKAWKHSNRAWRLKMKG